MLNPTEEQMQIIDALKQYNNLKVYAYAGTGKTTTLKMLTEHYSRYEFLYLAFNTAIAKEAKRKFPKNTTVRTTHALARWMVSSDIDTSDIVNKYKVVDILDLYDDIPNYQIAKLVLDCFSGYCHSNIKDIKENNIYSIIFNDKDLSALYKIQKQTNRNLLEFITEKVNDIWNKMLDGQLKINHDFYLKYFQLNIDKYKHKFRWDCVLLDEAQDTNDVTLDIFMKLPVKKKIMVGDVYQKIYGFRKSINAMEKFESDKQLYLSTTFRFNEDIAQQANDILSNMRRETVLVKTLNKRKDDFIQSIAILSRTNSGLIEVADKLITEGKIFNTTRPVDEITRLPMSVLGYMYRDSSIVRDKWLYKFDSIEEMEDFARDINDVELISAISIVKSYKGQLYDIVEVMRGMEKLKANIYLSTAHSAKGLEWDRVIVLDNFPDIIDKFIENNIYSLDQFHKLLKSNNKDALEVSEEINLMYVAITRAKKQLINNSKNKVYFKLSEEEFNDLIKKRLNEKNEKLEV